jgi:hypothetical protein
MHDFSASLLREKFIIHELKAVSKKSEKPVVALSNRIVSEHKDEQGKTIEALVVRAQNMHVCARMGARILESFIQGGPLIGREQQFDWQMAWDTLIGDYEQDHNPDLWIAVYHNGRVLFESGARHPLLDVIEKCEARNDGVYDDSVLLAEDAFKQTGKNVKIEYDGNVALVAHLENLQARVGIILRAGGRTTTFNFSVASKDGRDINHPQCLVVGAAFLEGIQLSFRIGMDQAKIKSGAIKKGSEEEKASRQARLRLSRLRTDIGNLEGTYTVRYRPEQPDFDKIIYDAEKAA